MQKIEEKQYYIYISKKLDAVLLSSKDRGPGFVFMPYIFLKYETRTINQDNLIELLKQVVITTVLLECEGGFNVYKDFYSKTLILPQSYDNIILPKTLAYIHIIKETMIEAALESLLKQNCVAIARINKNKRLEVITDEQKKVIAFVNNEQAIKFVETNHNEDKTLSPVLLKIKETNRLQAINFINEGFILKRKEIQ